MIRIGIKNSNKVLQDGDLVEVNASNEAMLIFGHLGKFFQKQDCFTRKVAPGSKN